MASRPSQTISGRTTKAAIGSAHLMCQIALIASPVKAITERYAHSEDSAASALSAALLVSADSRRFSFASNGMNTAAAIRTAIPRSVGLGSVYPINAMAEVATTHAASTNSKTPAIWAARRSARSCVTLARNRHSTTSADSSSTALSPPKASNAGLRARHAASREITASTLIQPIVIA